MFHCLVIKVLCSPSCDSSFSLSQSFLFVKNFFKFFQNFLMTFVIRCLSATRLLYHIHFWMSSTFLKFFIFSKFKTSNGEGGIWTLAPVTRPIPLAGAPLRPLEYFSKVHYLIIWCCSMRSWRVYDNTKYFSVCQSLFFYIFILPVTVASLKKNFVCEILCPRQVAICDMLLIRRSAILAERFLCNGNKVSYYSVSNS